MKKLLLLVIFSLALALPTNTWAHILKTDGSIGAVLHIEPNDEPVAGVETTAFLEFKDKNNQFSTRNCACKAAITKNGREITSQLTPVGDNLYTESLIATYPEPGVYNLSIKGSPINSANFSPFNLTYSLRVTANNSNNNQLNNFFNNNFPIFALGGFVILIILILLSNRKKKGI